MEVRTVIAAALQVHRCAELIKCAVVFLVALTWHALSQCAQLRTDSDKVSRRRLLVRDAAEFLQPIDPEHPPLLHAAPESHSLMRWRALLCGSPDTPWRWVTIEMRIDFSSAYPKSPPSITLLTPLFHPNVDLATGKICADGLDPGGWSPMYHLHGLLANLQSLLFGQPPNTDSPLHARAAELYLEEQSTKSAQGSLPQSQKSPSAQASVSVDETVGPFWSQVYEVHQQNMTALLVD